MTVFWFVAALFVAGALLMLLPPLLSPAAEGPLRDVREAPARRTALGVGLALPLAAVALYLLLGSPQLAAPEAAPAAPAGGDRHALGKEQIEQRVAALAERLKAQPDDAEGWLMLGRSYTVLGRYRDGATALRRANELQPGNPNILADLADLAAMAQGKRLAGEPARLVQQALDADPRHPKALALAGSVAFESRDYAAARGYWERLLAVLPADSPIARSVQGSIAEAAQAEAGGAAPQAAAAPPARLSGEVRLSPELAARVAPGDTLFVFARAADGARMPLAVLRRPAGAAPFAFTLDDSMGMAGGPKLSSAAQVVVGARLSKSGNATPRSGDLVGQSAPLDPRSQGVVLTIDRVQP